MSDLLIAYSTQTGRTARLAQSAWRAARAAEPDLDIQLGLSLDTSATQLIAARGLILATPENFGYMSGAVKDLLDRSYEPAQGQMNGRPYLILVSAGNDGRGAVTAIERIANGFGWTAVAEPLIVRGEPTDADLAAAAERGQLMASGLAFGIF